MLAIDQHDEGIAKRCYSFWARIGLWKVKAGCGSHSVRVVAGTTVCLLKYRVESCSELRRLGR